MRHDLLFSGIGILVVGFAWILLSVPYITVSSQVPYQVPYQTTEREINKFFFGGATPSFMMNPNEVYSSSAWQMHPNYTDIYFAFITDQPLDIYIYNSVEIMKWEDGEPATPTLVKTRLNTGNYSYPIPNDAYAIVVKNNNPSSAYVQNFTFGESRDVQVTKYQTEYRTEYEHDYRMVSVGAVIAICGILITIIGALKPKITPAPTQSRNPIKIVDVSRSKELVKV